MKKQIILKGFHRPLQLIPACFKNMAFGNNFELCKTIEFTDSCRYNLGTEDQYDWNKLFGVCRGLFGIHKHSGRFAWRYNTNTGTIEIAAYSYIDGIRYMDFIKTIRLNKAYKFKLKKEAGYLLFYIDDQLLAEIWIGYADVFFGAGLYFGGNRRAPQKIIVESK